VGPYFPTTSGLHPTHTARRGELVTTHQPCGCGGVIPKQAIDSPLLAFTWRTSPLLKTQFGLPHMGPGRADAARASVKALRRRPEVCVPCLRLPQQGQGPARDAEVG